MKNLLSRWNGAQAVICAGIVCVAIGFFSNFIEAVYAQDCPNEEALYTLCVTTPFPVCPINKTGCERASEWDVAAGYFQCQYWPGSGKICYDSEWYAPCYTVYGCHVEFGSCSRNKDGARQPYSKMTKTWNFCDM